MRANSLVVAAIFANVQLVAMPAAVQAQTQASAEHLFTAAEVRSDLDVMYRRLQADAFDLYAFTPKPEMDRLFWQLKAGIDRPLTRFQAWIQFERLAAAAHQGHTRVEGVYAAWAAYRKSGGRAFPLMIRIVKGRVYVASNPSGMARLTPGDEILAIDDDPVAHWLDRVRQNISAETPQLADSILEYDFPMYVWVETGARPSFRVSAKKAGGEAFTLESPSLTQQEMAANAARQPPPLDLDHPLRDARILPNGTGYLRPGPFYNEEAKTGADEWDVTAFRHFIDSAFEMFNAKGVSTLIIDLRGNPGGDNLFSDVMVSWFADRPYRFFSSFKVRVSDDATNANRDRIVHDAVAAGPVSQRFAELYAKSRSGEVVDFDMSPTPPNTAKTFHGKVFALIDRQAYSNAVSVAATIQDYRFGKVMGEPTADMATAFGAMEQFSLPATGIVVGFPKAHIIRPDGDARPRGVTPDMEIHFPIVETRNDEVLRHAADMVATSR